MRSEPLPQFNDRQAEDEPFGFSVRHFQSPRLPGTTWETGHMFRNHQFPNCNMETGDFYDPVWSNGLRDQLRVYDSVEHRVFGEIFYSDAIRRLQAVEQLTLSPEYTTIPNTGAFSRFEHVWGSVLFVRQLAAKEGIDTEEAVQLQLRTLVSDIAHTFGSHLGDWMFQGVGGEENQHDLELEAYLETVGINDILRGHNINPQDVIFPEITDWIEAPQPDLCVDRVDYGLREMNRWNNVVQNERFTVDDFTITPENMLAMTDQRRARVFAEGFLLLSQEHWSEPTHRFMLDMLMLRTKLFYAEGRAPRSWVFDEDNAGLVPLHEIHPRDLMYVTDPAQLDANARPSLGGHIIEAIMKSTALYRRQYVWPGRQERIYKYMTQFADPDMYAQVQADGSFFSLESGRFDSYLDEYPKTLPGGVAMLDQQTAEATKNEFSIDIPQPPFKARQVDPLVQTEAGFKRLSEIDPSFALRLQEHKEMLGQTRVARLSIADPKTREILMSVIENVEEHWQNRLNTSRRMTSGELRRLVEVSASEIFGTYPFMEHLDY